MNKFEHFDQSELYNFNKFREMSLEIGDASDGCDYPSRDYEEKAVITLKGVSAREHAVDILNAALDAHLVQRVVNDPDKKPAESIEDKYTLKKLPDGKIWMMENLREKVEGAVWNEEYNCYMYTWEQAQQAVPKGFHLPSAREFMQLALALGYLDKSGKQVSQRLREECGFVFSGWADSDGNFNNLTTSGYWWSSTVQSAALAYYLYFNGDTVNPEYYNTKDHGFSVRCVKD